MSPSPVSPLSLNPLTRDLWGTFDATAIAQLARFAVSGEFSPKFYKAPPDAMEFLPAYGFQRTGLAITPGSVIYGWYLPHAIYEAATPQANRPLFSVQIRDVSLEHDLFSEPLAALFLSNYKPTYQGNFFTYLGSFPNLLCAPHPVTGSGLFNVDIQSLSASAQRIEFVIGVLEYCG